ncbi:hypothetical protein EXIGLDRAFT_839272 [Exidia glandulosa HHB12029]|uniref:Uncharacterized protein n=1 Tax=Exidia glandulosa HHB12029 TaxID=1314781 RepID=A0A165F587_EXIGL|nr:hypothetical protein EXIGLDRAFT_839272 [Exidia glandulosa HHB12029]
MFFDESERNDASPNPKRTATTDAPRKRLRTDKLSSASDADKNDKAVEPQHEEKHLTPRGWFAAVQKIFGSHRDVPSCVYVDILCSRYWRYKDASFVFYRGAVLSQNHVRLRALHAAGSLNPQYAQSAGGVAAMEWLREKGLPSVLNRLTEVGMRWRDLERAIKESSSKSPDPEDRDSFTTLMEDVALLRALDELWKAERKIDSTIHPSDWKRAIISKQKHDAKFEPFRDPERRRHLGDLYKENLVEAFGYHKLGRPLFGTLQEDLNRASEPTPFLPCARLDDTKQIHPVIGRC